ncbi:MAG: TIGR01212 family radical SAM protein [Hydrogenophilaceae bacterium]|nr:TIGR01212 family radical SAM protein [Hydrogenophilaceae bacterium]
MHLSSRIHTFGQAMLSKHGQRVHKIALDAGFTCPNRDGSKGIGGCTFCNNKSFAPGCREQAPLEGQFDRARRRIAQATGAQRFIAYFQAYTNTYAHVDELRRLYDSALAEPGVIGLSIGTRPDCVPPEVLDLLVEYQQRGHEVWLELGLQSSFDETLARVNRGHGFAEYESAACAARARGLPVCCHLILGLPGEEESHYHITLDRVLETGVDGLKLHPLHVVKHTKLAIEWKRGEYTPMSEADYLRIAADLIERTPWDIVFHRVTGTAAKDILLAPEWCAKKWDVLNGIARELEKRGTRQGARAGQAWNKVCHAA